MAPDALIPALQPVQQAAHGVLDPVLEFVATPLLRPILKRIEVDLHLRLGGGSGDCDREGEPPVLVTQVVDDRLERAETSRSRGNRGV